MTTRIEGIIDRLSEADEYNSISWILEAPVENIALAVVDDTMRENVAFQTEAGLKCTVTRTADANACGWCQGLDGTFVYPDVPDDLWHRHENCRCIIEYENERTGTHTWHGAGMGKSWKTIDPATLAERKAFQGVAVDPQKITRWELSQKAERIGVKYKPVAKLEKELTEEEIIARIAGGDKSGGSCVSLSHAYVGEKHGLDVLDYRGGVSREFFSNDGNGIALLRKMEDGGAVFREFDITRGKSARKYRPLESAEKAVESMKPNREYILRCGYHQSMVKVEEDGTRYYLELQSQFDSGWTKFEDDTLSWRFGCPKTSEYHNPAQLVDVTDFEPDEGYIDILGYINTDKAKQKKGVGGVIQ